MPSRSFSRSLAFAIAVATCLLPVIVSNAQDPAPGVWRAGTAIGATITMPTEGVYRFDGETVQRHDIPQRLVDALDPRPPDGRVVALEVGKAVPYDKVRDALRIVRDLGYDTVALMLADETRPVSKGIRGKIFPRPAGLEPDPSDLPPPPLPDRASDTPPAAPPRRAMQPQASTPTATGAEMPADLLVVEVTTTETGRRIAINANEMKLADLRPYLSKLLATPGRTRTIHFTASKETPFGDALEVASEIAATPEVESIVFVAEEIAAPRGIAVLGASPNE
jgi:biopolymer transport protein ExbD